MKSLVSLPSVFFLAMMLTFSACDEKKESDQTQSSVNTNGEMDQPKDNPKPAVIEESSLERPDTNQFDEIPDHASDAEIIHIKAKFIEFVLGDASHYTFEDEKGKMWDFGGCEADNCDFALELPEAEMNESNQGWGSNPEKVGKWFDLGYFETEQEMYIDGPVGTVYILAEVAESE